MHTRKIYTLIVLLLSFTTCFSQRVDGRWYSADKTRIYTIKSSGNGLEAVLSYSNRSGDTTGLLIIKATKDKKGKYKGLINTPDGGSPTGVKIRSAKNDELLLLKLPRMLLFPVKIRWYRI
jgi:hypothetical protein